MRIYGVIMAGGGGTRFWPLSRKALPKQLLNLSGKDYMINETIDRFDQVAEKQDIYVVTNETQVSAMRERTVGRLLDENILAEPAARNTAACIGYAAMEILKKREDGIMCILPADHFIQNMPAFQKTIKKAAKVAQEEDALVTIGIQPTFPATGYGYIRYDKAQESDSYSVQQFVEKPEFSVAQSYLESGNYLWNSGMFLWKASVIVEQIRIHLPEVYACLQEIAEFMGTDQEQTVLKQVYPNIPKISVDYGILEKAECVKVISGEFGWNDVGSFDSFDEIFEKNAEGNIEVGQTLTLDTHNCIVHSENKLIATIGLDDVIVIQTDDAVLVCKKEKAQDIKKIVEILEKEKKDKYL